MNLPELFARTTNGIRFDLDRIRRVLSVAGDPHGCAPAILIGGTNGKGSVTAMWSRALASERKRVGTYTSPHLVRFNERIVVDGGQITDDELFALFAQLEEAEKKAGLALTFFEAATWMAFAHFAACKVDVMVLEVGLGGRLDATNASDPAMSIITSIGIDHTEYLGDTIAAIAREKAGIFRPGRPLVVGRLPEEALFAVREVAAAAEIHVLHDVGAAPLMWGEHQRENAALFALSARLYGLGTSAVREGMQARVPGRYDVRLVDGVRYVIDGAHNGHAAEALASALLHDPELLRPRTLVFGGTVGRPPATTLGVLAPLFDRVVLCQPRSERALPMAEMRAVVPAAVEAANMSEALKLADAANVCVTGSLYLVGDALSALDGVPRDTVSDFR